MDYQEVLSRIIEIDETEKHALFAKGDLLLAAKEAFGKRGFNKQMAGELGCSTRYITEMMKVAKVFPDGKRALDQSWYLHRLASQTADPEYWLEKSIRMGWSTRQLQEALNDAGDTSDDKVLAQKKAERMRRSIEDFLKNGGEYAREEMLRIWTILGEWLNGTENN